MTRPLRVLLIEDSDDDALLVLQQLRRGGFEPSYERVDTEAAMKAALDAEPWDAVVSDYSMPHFDGLRALRVLQDSGLDIPFILVSGTIGEEVAVAAMKAGAHDYLIKDKLARLAPAIERELRDAASRREHLRGEAALHASEVRYRRLFESAKDGILMLDAETGLVVDVNPSLVELLGYPHEQFLGKPIWKLGFLKDLFAKRNNFTELQQMEYVRYDDMALQTSDGKQVQVEFVSNVYTADDKKVIQCNIRDITDRKQAEEMLVKTEAKQAKMMANIGDVIVIIDQDGINRYKSPNIFKWFGWKPEEVVGTSALDNVHPDDLDRARELIYDLMSEPNKTGTVDCRYRCKDDTYKWIKFTGVNLLHNSDIKGILGNYHDITKRKQAEAEKERFLTAIDQAAEVIEITDADATIEYVNPAFEKVTGYTREEVVGQNPRILKSGEHDDAFYRQMWDTLLSGETWSGRLINRRKDGTHFTEDATISPVKDAAGKIVNYVACKRDVTEDLKREDQIRQAQKMESLGQLVGGVAHDFNNLLQVINGNAEIAQMEIATNHSPAENIAEIAKAGEHARTLVRQLMTFSRRQVIDPMDLDLNEEIEGAKKMLNRVIGEHIQFRFIAGKGVGSIFADQGQIHQVLMNLCLNARDAMPDGGTVTIKTEAVLFVAEDQKTHPWAAPGRYALLSIQDTGCGMEKTTCEKIFEPFFTTKEMGKGTGLGLSTVYGIVQQNKGHIDVYSELNNGTVFKIYLPVSNLLEAGPGATSGQALAVSGGVETILVVEDEEPLLKLATRLLSEAGYTVLSAKDGEEAVRVFEENADQIDLVMMDVVMPRMGGKKAMEEILKKRPAIRHLFVSGYSPNAGHNDFIQEKGLYLLNKPYRAEALLGKIREVMEG